MVTCVHGSYHGLAAMVYPILHKTGRRCNRRPMSPPPPSRHDSKSCRCLANREIGQPRPFRDRVTEACHQAGEDHHRTPRGEPGESRRIGELPLGGGTRTQVPLAARRNDPSLTRARTSIRVDARLIWFRCTVSIRRNLFFVKTSRLIRWQPTRNKVFTRDGE